MLKISRLVRDQIVEHCLESSPIEACGVVTDTGRWIPMLNAENSADFYRFDPDQQLAVWSLVEASDQRVDVIYHSHTATPAYPSRTDMLYATELQAHYVIVSTWHFEPQFRSFQLVDGQLLEEPVQLT